MLNRWATLLNHHLCLKSKLPFRVLNLGGLCRPIHDWQQSQYRSSLVSYKVWRYLFPSERVQLKQTEWSHRWRVTRPPRARVAARGNLSLWLVWNLNQNRWQPLLWPTGSMPNISCYYKCGLSALPGKLCHRFYIFSREIAHWLQFGVITISLRAFIAILKKWHLHVFR